MAQLTADISRKYKLNPDVRGELPVAATTTIFMNSAVGHSGGYARPLQAGDVFVGFAVGRVSNVANATFPNATGTDGSTVVGAAGGQYIELRAWGITELTTITGATDVTAIGTSVYASDGNTFTTTATANSLVGKIVWYLNGVFGVSFKSALLA